MSDTEGVEMTASDKRFIGGGLRLASNSAAPLRLDHSYFEHEVRPLLGSILLQKGWISHERLDAALEQAKVSGMRLGETLLAQGFLFEPELASALAVPVRFLESGGVEVAVADPADAEVVDLQQILGRPVELAVGERSVIQDAWRHAG